ncbi:MAG: glycosyl hydrolase family 5 [Candidatus Coatesbacteria bacterium]
MSAAKLSGVAVLDRDHLTASFLEGEVKFKDDGEGPVALGGAENDAADNWVVAYGPLDVAAAAETANWTVVCADDPAYGANGKHPVQVFRRSKISGMAQLTWDHDARDWHYETPMGHTLYLKLPSPLREGRRYRLVIGPKVDPAKSSTEFVFDSFSTRSEALHVNLVGYPADVPLHSADLYAWLGDGGARDYAAFEGAKVFLVDAGSGAKREAGTVKLWKKRGEDLNKNDFTASDVWTADVTGGPGTYRIAVEGIGCSQDFAIGATIYAIPFKVTVRGYYYMRIGEVERPDIRPIPRQPPFIPGKLPPECRVLITTMHPYHPEWKTFAHGDKWDPPHAWEPYVKPGRPENPNAFGGHSDALDWDRHLGHVSSIYDMLLPYILTDGALGDDDCSIAESGNGIPDLLDEARNEVDFWLRLRDGEGYSHGLTNPTKEHVFYQAANTTVAAWANAANAAMLSDCFRIGGQEALKKEYLAHAVTAWNYASRQPDQELELAQGEGGPTMRGADFKMTAAAFLFNLTGEAKYEDVVNELSVVTDNTADVVQRHAGQLWATAGYLLSPRKSRFPELRERMRKSILHNAVEKEVAYADRRPSRRSTNQEEGYFYTAQNVQRTLIAHRITDDPRAKARFLAALVMEADWGLGRNSLNMIQMTTATTPLAKIRSVENCYTSGRNDGTPGLHPGHTPYLNMDDWGRNGGMIMARPRWMAVKGYPAFEAWPRAECYFNTRWVWAHSEFTPQQTMRGKTALYGYLYGIEKQGR